jgi:CheY-like chemotaxis protein
MEKKTILMIEDNELNRKLIRALLPREEFLLLEAEDAESGIRLIRERSPDLILMDIQLPGMDGLTATSIIKKDPCLKGIPVMALTSYAMEGDAEKAKVVGCDRYMTKPIDTRLFRVIVRELLGSSKRQDGE